MDFPAQRPTAKLKSLVKILLDKPETVHYSTKNKIFPILMPWVEPSWAPKNWLPIEHSRRRITF